MSYTVLITGGNGQLAQEIKLQATSFTKVLSPSKEELDITNYDSVRDFLLKHKPQLIFNCAAYTAVDAAESNITQAYAVNELAVANLLELMDAQTVLIHYSTDYVYADTREKKAIKEEHPLDPKGVYAASKLAGDQLITQSSKKAISIRTSWVYSSFGHNFVKTMLRLSESRNELNVVNDQIGTPTYAYDLAQASIKVAQNILEENISPEVFNKVYHYANTGAVSWCDFAKQIFLIAGSKMTVHPIPSSEYPTPAQRPHWSVLDSQLIADTFGVELHPWKVSLERCMEKIMGK